MRKSFVYLVVGLCFTACQSHVVAAPVSGSDNGPVSGPDNEPVSGSNSGSKPVVYLTFDDGPSRDNVTERILALLERYNAKATFFVTGQRARANPEKIAKIVVAGHALGNHTHSHGKLTTLFDHEVAEEFTLTNKYVYAAGGPPLNCFRAPFGATDKRVNSVASRMGMRAVGWTIDTRDWDIFVEESHMESQLEDSENKSVVLMHDGPKSRWRTLEVLTRWMEHSGHLYDFQAMPQCVQPYSPGTYAALDSSIETVPRAPVTETIAELIKKLGQYKIELQPEVVAQNTISPTATY